MNHPPRRFRALFAAALTLATSVSVFGAQPAIAGGNSLYFSNGSDNITVGAGAAIYIDGTITFDANCQGGTRPGIDDFVYPATDVYIVNAGSATDDAPLTDAGGYGPNTIVGVSSGAFIGELIAVVTPSGTLGEGEFDVVYDTCQDGVVGPEDEVWYDAITVDVPDGQLPPVDASIRRVKDAAREEYAAWIKTHMGLTALFKFEDALAIAGCILAPSPGCLADVLAIIYDVDSVMAKSSDWIEGQTLNLVMNRAKNYGAIWQDPVDPAFEQFPSLTPEPVLPVALSGEPVADAIALLPEPLAEEGELADELLHALERYQGAQAAGDEEWALVQARAVADLSTALAGDLRSSTAIADLRDALAAEIDAVVARAADGATVVNRIRTTGLTPDERRELANRGFDAIAIAELEARFVADGHQVAPNATQILGPIDELLAARVEMADALDESAAGWTTLAASLAAQVEAPLPTADAGGPYSSVGGAVTLDATASTTPDGTAITTVEWDLDGDGSFDDASGASAGVTVERSRSIAVRVTNDAGFQAVGVTVVTVDPTLPPAPTASPVDGALVLTAGASQQFTFDVPGASGYRWTVDGAHVADTGSFTYDASPDAVGEHVVSASASHGGRTIAHSWVVSVLLPDADGDEWTSTSDCNDERADVHPGAFERLGNGQDDDCDPGTPDEPVGGLTGEVWSWGYNLGVGTGTFQDAASPVKVTSLGDQVRAIESGYVSGYALLADGTVRAWGSGSSGQLGNGSRNQSRLPVVVQNVGGGGALGGVVQVASDGDTALALRADGSVVAWGNNLNQQVGDDSDVDYKLFPVEVLDGETGQPLTGAGQVEYGENSSYAVMQDGTVKVWGVARCNGTYDWTRERVAVTEPKFGDDVVQLESGDHGGAIVITEDGAVKVCSSYRPLLGRGSASIPYNEQMTPRSPIGLGAGSGVIDVAMGMESVAALKDDGTVWMWGRNLNHSLDLAGVPHDYVAWEPVQVQLPAGPPVIAIEMDYSVTVHALRADGSIVVWGGNVYNSAGNGQYAYEIIGADDVAVGGGVGIALANSVWNGMAIVRPADPSGEPVHPLHWIEASIADASIGEAGGGAVAISLSQAAPTDVNVEYEFDGDAGSILIPAGSSQATAEISVADDLVDEDDEQLPIRITAVSDGVRTARHTGLVTVLDDDAAPQLAIADATVVEGDTSLTDVELTVALSAPSSRDVVVDLVVLSGSAELGLDVTPLSSSLLIPAGETSATAHGSVIGDDLLEDAETFSVELSNPEAATIADGSGTVTIQDDEPLVVSVVAPAVIEGDAGATPAAFTVDVSQPPTADEVTIAWSVVPGTAEAGSDIVVSSDELVLAGGETGVVEVAVIGDTEDEALDVETFRLALGAVTAASGRAVVVSDTPVATISDDDTLVVTVDAGPDLTGSEGSALPITGAVTGLDQPNVAWTVDAPGCTVADPAALATSVTCVDEVQAVLTLTADGTFVDQAALTISNVAPAVTIVTPASGQQVNVDVPVALATQLSDPGVDDVLSCVVDWGDGSPAASCAEPHTFAAGGTPTITVTVADGDGGATSTSVEIVVVGVAEVPAFEFDGFFQPVDNAPTLNVVKAGSTVPLKFGLGGDHGLAIFESGFPASAQRPCEGDTLDALEETATPGSATLTYDPETGRYHYNWKTSKAWAGQCRTLVMRFVDGTEVTAEFRFK